MAKRKGQSSSKPAGWIEKGMVIPISLTVKQERYALRAIGISRFVYNLALSTHRFHRKNRMKWPSIPEMERAFNEAKKEDYPFVCAVSKFVAQGAFKDFGNAVKRWRNPELRSRAPRIKKKKRTGTGSFLAASGVANIHYDGNKHIKLHYLGNIKLLRKLPEGIILVSCHIKKKNGQWLLSLNYYAPAPVKADRETQAVGGLDVGINPLTSWVGDNGEEGEDANPKAYYKAERKLRRWQRAQARRTVGSRGWNEAQRRIDKLNRRIVNLRNKVQHKVSKELITRFHTLGIESLNVKGMIKAGLQSKALCDAAIGGLLNKIRYKAKWYGTELVIASQWYPSSKTCSECGEVNSNLGREKIWHCPFCGVRHDRNRNAARNLLKLALGAVSLYVTPGDGKALANSVKAVSETGSDEPGCHRNSLVGNQFALIL